MDCPYCGEEAPADAKWCEACGQDLNAEPLPACVSCGEREVAEEGYCLSCGHKQPEERDHMEFENGPAVAVTDRGKRHRHNEDAVAIGSVPGGAVVLVVCDGVSTTAGSAEASLRAATAARDLLVSGLDGSSTGVVWPDSVSDQVAPAAEPPTLPDVDLTDASGADGNDAVTAAATADASAGFAATADRRVDDAATTSGAVTPDAPTPDVKADGAATADAPSNEATTHDPVTEPPVLPDPVGPAPDVAGSDPGTAAGELDVSTLLTMAVEVAQAEASASADIAVGDNTAAGHSTTAGHNPGDHGVGGHGGPPSSTFVAVVVQPTAEGAELATAWVGDSRAYWIGEEARRLSSVDHEVAGSLVRWLGADSLDPTPDIELTTVVGPGHVVVCSDGLWRYAQEAGELNELVQRLRSDGAHGLGLASAMVDFANEGGGHDNITVALWTNTESPTERSTGRTPAGRPGSDPDPGSETT